MIFVPATPGAQLKHRYMKEIKETGFKVRVVEQSGTTLKSSSMLQKSNPFNRSGVQRSIFRSAELTERDLVAVPV